jgi:hypothetical protein
MDSIGEFLKKAADRTRELEAAIDETRANREQTQLQSNSDFVYDRRTGTFYIPPHIEILKYWDLDKARTK